MRPETTPKKKPAPKANPTPKPNPKPACCAPRNTAVSMEERQKMVEFNAYLRAERRGFVGGCPNDDWAAAEKEVDATLESMI